MTTHDAGVAGGIPTVLATGLKMVAVIPLSLIYILDSCLRSLIPRRMKRGSVDGKTVLITGGGSGLGRLLAQRLATRGANIIIWGRNKQNLEQTQQLVEGDGGRCQVFVVDITDREAIYRTARLILQSGQKVDILVNNAGVVYGKNILDSDDTDIRNTFNVNVISHFYTTKAFLAPMLKSNSGQIVTVSSLGGYTAVNKMTDYCASKFAAVGFSESLTMELRVNGNTGVSTTLVCPYYIDTGMFAGVRSRLVPVMTPDYVADEVTDAILMKSRFCILPWYGSISIFLACCIPDKLQFLVSQILGLTDGMDNFGGSRKYQ